MEVEITLENLSEDYKSHLALSNSEDDDCLWVEMSCLNESRLGCTVSAKINIEELKLAIRKITLK